MKSFTFPLLLALIGLVAPAVAKVEVTDGNPLIFKNLTSQKQNIVGLRTELTPLSMQGVSSLKTQRRTYNGVTATEGYVTATWDKDLFDPAPGASTSIPLAFGGAPSMNTVPLYKLGSCNQPVVNSSAPALSQNQLSTLVASSAYYDASHKYVDHLGSRGGKGSGGLFDTYTGETQALFALPTASFTVNGSVATYNANVLNSPMSFMSLIMAQEYFSIDWQFLLSDWSKETAFMLSTSAIPDWHRSLWSNADGAFGPGEVESTTFVSRALGYPKFFPYSTCLSGSGVRDVASAMAACRMSEVQFAADFMGSAHTDPDSAQIVGATLASALTLIFNYDLLGQSFNLGFKQALEQSADPKLGLCAMLPLYNLGINSSAESPLYAPKNWSSMTCNDFPTGNGNYRVQVIDVANQFEAEADKASPNYIDRMITLEQVRRFFFGENSSATQPWTANGSTQVGGLMKHFNIGDAKKQAMWNDLSAAFDVQAAHWGGGKISLRYDWISLLRIAKKYLDLDRGNVKNEEAANWISQRSSNTTDVLGHAIDNKWPYAQTSASSATNGIEIMVQSTELDLDESGIKSVEWTANEDWSNFNTQYTVSALTADSHQMNWKISIPSADVQALQAAGTSQIYVRVTDNCGNAIVLEQSIGGLSATAPRPALGSAWSLWNRDEYLRAHPGVMGVEVRAVDGSKINAGQILDPHALPQGSYLFKRGN